jgi:CRISPR-associated protein Cmr3
MTDTLHAAISPIDTVMFRDGRPFNQMDAGAGDAVSVFPPYPPTLVGAVRMTLARMLGYETGKAWPREKLGDGVDWQADAQLGNLRFSGAILVASGKPLFPAPLFLGSSGSDFDTVIRLRPSDEVRDSDLGPASVPVPDVPARGIKIMENCWLTSEGMQRTLDGKKPQAKEVISSAALWTRESTMGVCMTLWRNSARTWSRGFSSM